MKKIVYESSAVINDRFYEFEAVAESKDDTPNSVSVSVKVWGKDGLVYTNESTYTNEQNPWTTCCEYDETTLIEDYVQGKLADAENAIQETRPSENYVVSCIGGVQRKLNSDWWANFRVVECKGLSQEERTANGLQN